MKKNKNRPNFIYKLALICILFSIISTSVPFGSLTALAEEVDGSSKGMEKTEGISGGTTTPTESGNSSGGEETGTTAPVDDSYKKWKQFEGEWSDRLYVSSSGGYKFGDKVKPEDKDRGLGTVSDWGCYLVSLAIQMAKSGSAPGKDPWDFIEFMHNNKYLVNDSDGLDSLVSNEAEALPKYTNGKFRVHGSAFKQEVSGMSREEKIKAIQTALDAGLYPIARIKHSTGGYHFVAIDKIENGVVVTMDPGSSSTDLFGKYGDKVDQIRVFESDVPSNKAGQGQANPTVTAEEKEEIELNIYKWDKGAIPGMPKPRNWEEEPVPIVSYSELNSNEKDSIEKWKEEVEQSKRTDVITIARVITMMFGIGVLLFSLVYLVAFVFDRITFTEWKMMEFLTRNKLSVSATGESTFFKGNDGYYPKLINVKDLIIIEFLMIGFSVIILSGMIFKIIAGLIEFMKFIQDLLF